MFIFWIDGLIFSILAILILQKNLMASISIINNMRSMNGIITLTDGICNLESSNITSE